jgi:hypothetical protein
VATVPRNPAGQGGAELILAGYEKSQMITVASVIACVAGWGRFAFGTCDDHWLVVGYRPPMPLLL